MISRFIVPFLAMMLMSASTEAAIEVTLTEQAGGVWRVAYKAKSPIDELVFVRPVHDDDSSRRHHWISDDHRFEIVYADGQDRLRRIDGRPFVEVGFVVGAAYRPITFDYPTFQSFTDGGLLLYSGRFLACADSCDRESSIRMRIVPASGRRTIGGDPERYAYIGDPIQTVDGRPLTIIDPGLPFPLRRGLNDTLPRLDSYFRDRLRSPAITPMLFASYNPTDSFGEAASDGGTLEGEQVYLHFLGKGWQKPKPEDLAWVEWFFAHETAHLYQASPVFHREHSWIKEGGAEAMAARAVVDLGLWTEAALSEKIKRTVAACANALTHGTIAEHARNGNFEPTYDCGFLFQFVLDAALRRQSDGAFDLFDLWLRFIGDVDAGADADSEAYLAEVGRHLPGADLIFPRQLISERLGDPEADLEAWLRDYGLWP